MTASDNVNHPSHYTAYPVEVIQVTERLPFCVGNAVKYLSRAGLKGGPEKEREDEKKALWYLDRAASGDAQVRATGMSFTERLNHRADYRTLAASVEDPRRAEAIEGICQATDSYPPRSEKQAKELLAEVAQRLRR